jgi:hypothetical protein
LKSSLSAEFLKFASSVGSMVRAEARNAAVANAFRRAVFLLGRGPTEHADMFSRLIEIK